MKKYTDELDKVLQEAEASVLRVLARAAESADYAAIDRARHLAEQIRMLGSASAGHQVERQTAESSQTSRRKRKRRKPISTPSGYPKFRVNGGSLFKTGWSKKKNQEYEHRVPLEIVENVVAALDQLANRSPGAVTGEGIIESAELHELGQLPSYQVYIILAMLRGSGVIEATGREGYRLPQGLAASANEAIRAIAVED